MNNFKIGGYKMFLDGSPQNKTAWTISPYVDGTYGYPTLTDEQLKNNLIKAVHSTCYFITAFPMSSCSDYQKIHEIPPK